MTTNDLRVVEVLASDGEPWTLADLRGVLARATAGAERAITRLPLLVARGLVTFDPVGERFMITGEGRVAYRHAVIAAYGAFADLPDAARRLA